MLNIIRKIQQRTAAIESKYSKNAAWLNTAHASYLDAVNAPCPIPNGNPCLNLECQGFDSREQDYRDIMKTLAFDGAHDVLTPGR